MEKYRKSNSRFGGEKGLGLMEVIVGVLVTLIVCSILLHLVRLGYEVHKLNSTTSGIADKLGVAREQAMNHRQDFSVIFEAESRRFGLDLNNNGRLDTIESDELPEGVGLLEDAIVTFSRSGNLKAGSKEPEIIISNSRDARTITVSSLGAIEID
ncbi:MAG: hypothetical protein L0229_13005 [Blastocatellia bacterium]|nr:hypothetical protein [Blastocatellia bacterium]